MKKVISLVLAFIMMTSMICMLPLTSNASTAHTQSEAVAWARQWVKNPKDYDGAYGVQCVDLAMAYYNYLGVNPASGSGCDYATNALPSGWQRIKYSSGTVPQPGDIVVWTYASSSSGHVAVVISATSSSMYVAEANGSTHTGRENTYSYSYGTLWGFIRPDFSGSSSVINPQISSDRVVLKTGENVTFTYSGLTICSQAVFYFEKNGTIYYSQDSTSSRTMTTYFENEGSYQVSVGGYYNGQWYYSGKLSIYVFNPTISVSKTTVAPYEHFTVSYDKMTYCDNVKFYVYKNGSYINQYDSTSSKTMDFYFADEAIYTFKAVGTVGNTTIESGLVDVKVQTTSCSHSYSSKITKQATCTASGIKTYTCSKCGDSYTETIPALGHNYTTKTIAPTCTEKGYTLHTCTRCGNSYKDNYVSAKGHTPGDWEIISKPTYDEEGLKIQVCEVCGEELDTDIIPMLIKNGWFTENGNTCYYVDGEKITSKLYEIDGKKYYFGDNGEMFTGWHEGWRESEGTTTIYRFYFGDNGVMRTGWQKIGKKWYYFNSSGAMQTGWQKLSGKWYYFDADGIMQTGWQKISKKWYYFNSSGARQTGWQKISNKWYYFNSSGVMLTGWQKISNKWYYFESSGAMKTGWLKLSGKWYYLNSSGVMLANCSQKIGSKTYKFNKSGVCLNP